MNSSYSTIPDQELLNRFYSDGDNRWLGILFQRYTLLLFGVCMKYLKNEEEAKDAVQQVFEKAIKELGKYKVDYFKSWLYMVAKNYCLMQLRDKGKLPKELSEQMLATPAEEANKTELLQKDELLEKLSIAVTELIPEQRTCIELFYLQKKSYTEIADDTGFTLMQVKSYIQNGKRNLKMILLKQQKHGR
ncbi:sigma-70 family RNA polymerase sigma factor [Lacibacter luteus]|uniref:Sigma-70 family RNA polymerase sigma factor n=1 Tax=Lacibacter luteus TaxID=2508719 RepID=A0A4Q1CNC6_9BACT|nr:sigma-70 family RNA polymerase sigma factor [Lacibacter luteus]RXK62119.1 sigma-70 family RNA polymerase sigma factor [Lacibacter luteus]